MHPLPTLLPSVRRYGLPPIKYRTKPFQKFCRSLGEALAEIEQRYPSRRPMTEGTRVGRSFSR